MYGDHRDLHVLTHSCPTRRSSDLRVNTPRDNAFRANYKENFPNWSLDVYAVQGYDAAQMLDAGLKAVNGDVSKKDAMRDAIRTAKIDSPRGEFTLSKAGNPVQDIYLRKVEGDENKVVKVAVEKLADPARGSIGRATV